MNTPKFDLGAMLSAPQTAIQQIPCDQLHPYHNHKFELYSGERLEDMVASIKAVSYTHLFFPTFSIFTVVK